MEKWMTLILVAALGLLGCQPSQEGQNSNFPRSYPSLAHQNNLGSDSSQFFFDDIDNQDRENWQKPQMVISRLGDLSSKTVADIGAGTGYFSIRLARKAKKVIAIDIEEQYLNYINRRISSSRDGDDYNLETRLTPPNTPSLQPKEADLVFMVNTYAFIQNRVAYFAKVRIGMAPQGELVIIDFKKAQLPVGPPYTDKLSARQVKTELNQAGFDQVLIDSSSLSYQYTITASTNNSKPAPGPESEE